MRNEVNGAPGKGSSEGFSPKPLDWEALAIEAEFKPANMAQLCAVSERHLQRIFRKQVGRTPSRWLRELQCRLAKELISKGYSSKAAAEELKFATESHFCREFKKVFGAPPQSFAPNAIHHRSLAAWESLDQLELQAAMA